MSGSHESEQQKRFLLGELLLSLSHKNIEHYLHEFNLTINRPDESNFGDLLDTKKSAADVAHECYTPFLWAQHEKKEPWEFEWKGEKDNTDWRVRPKVTEQQLEKALAFVISLHDQLYTMSPISPQLHHYKRVLATHAACLRKYSQNLLDFAPKAMRFSAEQTQERRMLHPDEVSPNAEEQTSNMISNIIIGRYVAHMASADMLQQMSNYLDMVGDELAIPDRKLGR